MREKANWFLSVCDLARERYVIKKKSKSNHSEPIVVNSRTAKKYGLDLRFRKFVSGPEGDLIKRFLKNLPVYVSGNQRVVVFVEPRIESGAPDIVIVMIRERLLRRWNGARDLLGPKDLRLLHYLDAIGPRTASQLNAIFKDSVERSLVRLSEAGMTFPGKGKWHAHSFHKLFAATEIIAVEAKINEWARVRRQAELNTWFASRSVILVPGTDQALALHSRLFGSGLGVWVCGNKNNKAIIGRAKKVSQSYVSWLFSEMASKVLLSAGQIKR